jgi:iron complex outermembrane receptor protein
VITRQEIQAFGWHTIAEALASLPGVYTTYDRQYSYIGVRGFGLPGDLNTRVLVTINGNRVNDPTFDQGPTGPEFPIDMDMIERIEYIPGPGGAVYGQNATLAVINIITRSGADLGSGGRGGAEIAATYEEPQALTAGRASVGHVFDNGLNVLVSATDLYSRGENRYYNFGAAGVSGVAVGMDGERNQQFLVSVARVPGRPPCDDAAAIRRHSRRRCAAVFGTRVREHRGLPQPVQLRQGANLCAERQHVAWR